MKIKFPLSLILLFFITFFGCKKEFEPEASKISVYDAKMWYETQKKEADVMIS